MAFLLYYIDTSPINILRNIMKVCVICEQEFNNISCEKACSARCKILDGIKKEANGCWIWKKSSNNGLYGKLRLNMKWVSSHRASYEVFIGEIGDKLVCHKCDVKLCCNPDHLYLGTYKDNSKDAKDRKLLVTGENNHFSRYTDSQIEEMRMLKKEGFTYERLQRIFNCSPSYLVQVIKDRFRI